MNIGLRQSLFVESIDVSIKYFLTVPSLNTDTHKENIVYELRIRTQITKHKKWHLFNFYSNFFT